MNAKDAIKQAAGISSYVVKSAVSDLSDAEWFMRPVPGANHVAWQMGHLISSAASFYNGLPGVMKVELPAGFAEKHKKETAAIDTPSAFFTKAQYLELFDKVEGAILKALEASSDAELDTPTEGPMASFAPTRGAMFVVMATHPTMHMGQFSVLRRKLGKPLIF